MSIFKCKMCGGDLEVTDGASIIECEYCGTTQTLPKLDDNRRINLYDRANHFRRSNEFDKAMAIYEQILNDENTDAEAYWSLVLCRYGIEYVEDPVSKKRIPTVNRTQYTSIFDDSNYKAALEYADISQKVIYEQEAKLINDIQRGILQISQKEEPFDVFICYKETDANGRRTPDSVLATDLYHQLTKENFRVFFSRITLEDKLGQEYEPYIFAALNSAKVMVVLGTKPEYFNAVWVKNEWSRFLNLIKNGAKKTLVPAYRDMDPYNLPDEFSHLQALDMSKLGFMQDLIRGIKKITGADEPKPAEAYEPQQNVGNFANSDALLKRASMFLEDGEFKRADEFCEQVLNQNPENAMAYVYKLMADLKVKSRADLGFQSKPFDKNNLYTKAYRFGNENLRAELIGYNSAIYNRIEESNRKKLQASYDSALLAMNSAKNQIDYVLAAKRFEALGNFADSASLAVLCHEKAAVAGELSKKAVSDAFAKVANAPKNGIGKVKEAICRPKKEKPPKPPKPPKPQKPEKQPDAHTVSQPKRKKSAVKIIAIIIVIVVLAVLVVLWLFVLSPMLKYNDAMALLEEEKYDEAIEIFIELEDYKDSTKRVVEARKDKIVSLAESGKYSAVADFIQSFEGTDRIVYREALLDYVDDLIDDNMLDKAQRCLEQLGTGSVYDDCYGKIVSKYIQQREYKKALDAYEKLTTYDENSIGYKSMVYGLAEKYFEDGEYVSAAGYFGKISGYSDSREMSLKSKYEYVKKILEDYKTGKNIYQVTTGTFEDYYNQLSAMGYEDVEELYDEAFAWELRVIVNSSPTNTTSDTVAIRSTAPTYIHVLASGGPIDGEVWLNYKITYPSGRISESQWDFGIGDGGDAYVYWESGVRTEGTLKIEIFDSEGDKLAERTVLLTE